MADDELKRLTRGQAIRAKCLECMCGSAYEVKRCVCTDCPLFRYRLGHEETREDGYTSREDTR